MPSLYQPVIKHQRVVQPVVHQRRRRKQKQYQNHKRASCDVPFQLKTPPFPMYCTRHPFLMNNTPLFLRFCGELNALRHPDAGERLDVQKHNQRDVHVVKNTPLFITPGVIIYSGPHVKDQKTRKESLSQDSRNEELFIHIARGYPSR